MAILITKKDSEKDYLKSLSYQASYQKVCDTLTDILRRRGYSLDSRNDTFFELHFLHDNFRILATVLMDSPRKTRIDFLIEAYGLFSKSKAKKELLEINELLKKELTLCE